MIPVCEPLISPRDIELVNDALASGWISSAGKYLDMFEERWAKYCDMPFGIAVSNGSTALDLAVELLDLEPGDEVIMPAFTIISPVQSVVNAKGVPVLVDSDPFTWQMDVRQIEAKITPRTKAILVVHIYGHSADMDPVMELAGKHGLVVIEDAAEVHGALYKGKRCGGIGHISTFSFYANKLVTTGEGGMVLVRTRAQAERARSLRNLCFLPDRRFYHEALGHNFRMTNVQAAMGVGQIERIEATVERKREIAHLYDASFDAIADITLPTQEPWARSVYWVYGVVIGDSRSLDAAHLISRLRALGVESRPFFWCMHEQPVFRQAGLFLGEAYPVAEKLGRQGFYLPNGLSLSKVQQSQVISAVCEVLS